MVEIGGANETSFGYSWQPVPAGFAWHRGNVSDGTKVAEVFILELHTAIGVLGNPVHRAAHA